MKIEKLKQRLNDLVPRSLLIIPLFVELAPQLEMAKNMPLDLKREHGSFQNYVKHLGHDLKARGPQGLQP